MKIHEKASTGTVRDRLQIVSVCLKPPSLATSVCADLASRKTKNFLFFSEYREDATIVIVNGDEALFRALDADQQIIQVKEGLSEAGILERLASKFILD